MYENIFTLKIFPIYFSTQWRSCNLLFTTFICTKGNIFNSDANINHLIIVCCRFGIYILYKHPKHKFKPFYFFILQIVAVRSLVFLQAICV